YLGVSRCRVANVGHSVAALWPCVAGRPLDVGYDAIDARRALINVAGGGAQIVVTVRAHAVARHCGAAAPDRAGSSRRAGGTSRARRAVVGVLKPEIRPILANARLVF